MLIRVDRFHHEQPNQAGSVEDPPQAFIGRDGSRQLTPLKRKT